MIAGSGDVKSTTAAFRSGDCSMIAAMDAQNDRPRELPRRNLRNELLSGVLSRAVGAFGGLSVGGNGLGFVGFIVLCSLLGCVGWVRRWESFLGTIGIWVLMLIVGWPICGILGDLGR